MNDGVLGKCKECTKSDVRKNRSEKADYYRAYDARRFQEDPRVRERSARYAATEAGKVSRRKSRKKWVAAHPDRRAAHIILGNAVRDGRVSKPSECAICGSGGRIHGHHEDYSLPLVVKWLCAQCHVNTHKDGVSDE